jgi:S-adenosylmethionine:tRNA ribosyltransferase-isomerase
MKLSDFDFPLPEGQIAQRPAVPRDAARLLRVTGGGLADLGVRDLPAELRPGDLLVVNDTAVIPARLFGHRRDVAIEVTLLEEQAPGRWRALAKKAKRLRPGDTITFADDFACTVAAKHADGAVDLAFDRAGAALAAALERHGAAPLPPYIRRDAPDARDRADYQTLFAARPGAIAAPTAGLHFTPALLAALAARGIERATVTLHVGAGTFLPVKSETVAGHVMHAERGEIGADAAQAMEAARRAGGRIVAVGTTVLRLLETAAADTGRVRPWQGATDLFLVPGHRFRTADLLLTNFHLPRSTLFMLVCAFAGTERMRRAYAHAVAAGYRFYSYGDACLLDRSDAA